MLPRSPLYIAQSAIDSRPSASQLPATANREERCNGGQSSSSSQGARRRPLGVVSGHAIWPNLSPRLDPANGGAAARALVWHARTPAHGPHRSSRPCPGFRPNLQLHLPPGAQLASSFVSQLLRQLCKPALLTNHKITVCFFGSSS